MTLDIPARGKLRLVSTNSGLDIPRLKKLACELREWASQSKWPDLAERHSHSKCKQSSWKSGFRLEHFGSPIAAKLRV